MNTLQFKTNLKCDGCVAKLKPVLEARADLVKNWEVDLNQKTLSVTTDADAGKIQDLVAQAGYKAELIP
jgi:copper chaperone